MRAELKCFVQLHDSEEWQSGDLTGTVLATLEDYLEEYEHYVLPAFFKRCGGCMSSIATAPGAESPPHPSQSCHCIVFNTKHLDAYPSGYLTNCPLGVLGNVASLLVVSICHATTLQRP